MQYNKDYKSLTQGLKKEAKKDLLTKLKNTRCLAEAGMSINSAYKEAGIALDVYFGLKK